LSDICPTLTSHGLGWNLIRPSVTKAGDYPEPWHTHFYCWCNWNSAFVTVL